MARTSSEAAPVIEGASGTASQSAHAKTKKAAGAVARQLSGPAHRPRSWSHEIDFSPVVLAHWCCAWAAPTIIPRALVVTILTHVLLRQATCLVTEKRGTSRSRSLLKALSLALEILVTLLALSMRLSPISKRPFRRPPILLS